jgi:hypothetical protein
MTANAILTKIQRTALKKHFIQVYVNAVLYLR